MKRILLVAAAIFLASPAFAEGTKITIDLPHDTDATEESSYHQCGKLKFGIAMQGSKQNSVAVLSTAKADIVMAFQGRAGKSALYSGQGYLWSIDEDNQSTLSIKGKPPVKCKQTGYPGDGVSPDWPY